MRATAGYGRAVSTQSDYFAAPLRAWQQPGTIPGVIQTHGAGGSWPINYANGFYGIMDALRNSYCYAAGDFQNGSGGIDGWGNASSTSSVDSVKSWMQTMGAKSGKVAFVGASMGAITALNYALAHPTSVACIAMVLPALNLNDLYANNRNGLASDIGAAYGGSYSDASYGSTHNPIDYAASIGVPVKFWYSTADTLALPTYVTQFVSACATASASVISTTLDHGNDAVEAAPVNDIVSFIAGHLN